MEEDLKKLSITRLLRLFAAVLNELIARGVLRSRNNPVGDYAEWVTCRALDLELQPNSNEGFDAVDSSGIKYQIKGRRLKNSKSSRQLSIIRRLEDKTFDYLIGVLFNDHFSIREAYKIPHNLIESHSRYSTHVNGHIMSLNGEILTASDVERIDSRLREHV